MAQEMDGEREGISWLQGEEIMDKTSGLCNTPSFGKTNESDRLPSTSTGTQGKNQGGLIPYIHLSVYRL